MRTGPGYSRQIDKEIEPNEEMKTEHERCQANKMIPALMRTAHEAQQPDEKRIIRHYLRLSCSWIRIDDQGILATTLSIGTQDQATLKLHHMLMGLSNMLILSGQSQRWFEHRHSKWPEKFNRVIWQSPESLKAAFKALERGQGVLWPFRLAFYAQNQPNDADGLRFRNILLPQRSADKVLIVFSVWLPNQDHLNIFYQVPVGAFPQNVLKPPELNQGWNRDQGFENFNKGLSQYAKSDLKLAAYW
ncbi:hypothetical protein WJX73_009785 [Symbiochloris irregularis]|uniref:Uncharacterized protein n=1 Tax=Symbiochloris irregularis TaxID=706552 RepID=A0AAW1NU99_9CHLO